MRVDSYIIANNFQHNGKYMLTDDNPSTATLQIGPKHRNRNEQKEQDSHNTKTT